MWIDKLREFAEALDENLNRRDKAGMMKILSEEFAGQLEKGEKCKKNKNLGGAEAYRLIAESIHGTISTFEAIKEWTPIIKNF